MNKLDLLKEKAKAIVLGVSNDPQGRYQLRYEFYQKYGNPIIKGDKGLGNSELAFMQWEINRGVLNPLNDSKPGSPWWREVNSHFLYVATLAQLIKESEKIFEDVSIPVKFWLDYMDTPTEISWYRAHNSSIISGYKVADSIAFDENIHEQYFVNIVLYRVLYAQSMVEGVNFGILGKLFANPRGASVSIITDIESFYPSHYPLSKEDIAYVTHKAHNLEGLIEDVFDKLLILPHLDKLHAEAATWNSSPVVEKYAKNNHPTYPISDSDLGSPHFTQEFATKKIHYP